MRVSIHILCLIAFVPSLAWGASPGCAGWGFVMTGGPRVGLATEDGAVDSFGPEDIAAVPVDGWVAGVYHVNGVDGWDGATGFYRYDIRAPLSPGESKSWVLYVWATSSAPLIDRPFGWQEYFWPSGDPSVLVRMECIQKPEGVTGGPEVGTVWTEPWGITLPLYVTSDGLTGHAFRFTLTMIPEPASLLVLAAGLTALALRRRR